MNRYMFILSAVSALLLLMSCDRSGSEFVIADDDMPALWIKDNKVVAISESDAQYSFNRNRNTFRTMDDTMANYFMLECSQIPSYEGQTLSATLTYTTYSNVRTEKNVSFEVRKIDSDGKVWLWNQSRKIKAVVRMF